MAEMSLRWRYTRMEHGDVLLESCEGREHHWRVIVSIQYAAKQWIHIIGVLSGRNEPEATEAAHEFHVGRFEDPPPPWDPKNE